MKDMNNVGRKYRGTGGEGSEIPHLNPSSQRCLCVGRTQKLLSPTVPDFSHKFPFRGVMTGHCRLSLEIGGLGTLKF